jgi:hypothetical protein
MGNNSFLTLRQHIESLVLKTDRPDQAQDIHDLCHAIELLMQIEHMQTAMGIIKKDDNDFPSEFGFD